MDQSLQIIKLILIISTLAIVTFIDIKKRIIPDKILFLLLIPGVILNLLINTLSINDMIFGFLCGGGFLFLLSIISNGGIGGGDIKLMSVVGLLMGLDLTVKALIISIIISGFISAYLIIFKIKGHKDSIAFGPYLSLGIILSLIIK